MPWLLNFTDPDPLHVNGDLGDGRPWANGTDMASRARNAPPNNVAWDSNCRVTTYVDGLTAMRAMRNSLEAVIAAANLPGAPAVGARGHVYIADWRFNCMRDLSENNPWHTGWWGAGPLGAGAAARDQTAMGLVVRLLQAGVMVRIMVWLPIAVQSQVADLPAHVADHYLAASIVRYESNRLSPPALGVPLGVVALDARVGDPWSASHHQKMMVIRSPVTVPPTDVAFVGGVDLAYTRRSNLAPLASAGDWQSGHTIPNPANWWPRQAGVDYQFRGGPALPQPAWAPPLPAPPPAPVPAMGRTQASDLPESVYGDPTPAGGGQQQLWHDQHLMLEGPVVATIEHQFRERWVDHATGLFEVGLLGNANMSSGQVIFSTARAYNAGQILPLPMPAVPVPVAPPALPAPPGTEVQMWRTIPLRMARPAQPPALFKRGEFTVMAGIANAVWQARELIWMFDQYFWSVPLARFLNAALRRRQTLRLILILPPYADGDKPGRSHKLRNTALTALVTNDIANRVGVYNMWSGQALAPGNAANRGIYVHAKTHTYDNSLLVCGSANLNRRSFLCDTELACAVLDPAVVTAHQQLLWAQLFPGGATPWPALNLDAPNQGAAFFTQFQTAAADIANSLLIRDPWQLPTPRLPNGVERPVDASLPSTLVYNEVEPSSVNVNVEAQAANGGIDEIVRLLENTPGFGTWPWRQQ